MKAHEHFDHGARHARVHGEVAGFLPFGIGKGPVGGRAEPPHLARDRRAGLLLPLPHALDEALAAEVMAGLAFRLELALDHDLRGDAGVIGAHHPIGVEAAHAVVPDQGVHERLLERVPHVQGAGDVRRGQLYTVRWLLRIGRMPEVAARLPKGIPARLDLVRIKAFGEFHVT